MSLQVVPTKGNLQKSKKSLDLATVGYELLDKKRNILVREMMNLIDDANQIQDKIDSVYEEAYLALQTVNITLGFSNEISYSLPEEKSVKLDYRSVMGVEIPILSIEADKTPHLHYSLSNTNVALDNAYVKFNQVKLLTVKLAEVENSVYRLADAIKKTQKRANALKNIVIPRLNNEISFITNELAEKEREEFSRMKIIKNNKN